MVSALTCTRHDPGALRTGADCKHPRLELSVSETFAWTESTQHFQALASSAAVLWQQCDEMHRVTSWLALQFWHISTPRSPAKSI